jgi:pimeloyl-ACP methyl ester carboxylesterase
MQKVRSADGTLIAVETSGAGPALVLVNGALTDRLAATPLRPLLEARLTVVAYDRRGRRDSGDTAPYAPQREIEDLAAVIASTGGPAFVYGHSSGGILALRAAIQGLPIARLAAYEPPFIVQGTRPLPAADLGARMTALAASGDREGALRLFLVESVGHPPAALARISASPAWPRMLVLAHTTPYDSAVAGSFEVPRAALAALSLPLLMLHGNASFPWIIQTARAVAEAVPRAEEVMLEGQPHSPAAEALAPALLRFFAS